MVVFRRVERASGLYRRDYGLGEYSGFRYGGFRRCGQPLLLVTSSASTGPGGGGGALIAGAVRVSRPVRSGAILGASCAVRVRLGEGTVRSPTPGSSPNTAAEATTAAGLPTSNGLCAPTATATKPAKKTALQKALEAVDKFWQGANITITSSTSPRVR